MTRGDEPGLEKAMDGVAAIVFALCAGWSVRAWGIAPLGAGGAGALAGCVALAVLRRIDGTVGGRAFEPVTPEFAEPVDDTLLLEDRLVEVEPDSQVVRLFAVGGSGRPSHVPGQLAERIDTFLGQARGGPREAPVRADATQELYEALAEIRRTLR